MHDAGEATSSRGKYEGLYRVLQFNWAKYLLGCVSVAGGIVLLKFVPIPDALRWPLIALLVVVGWWLIAALIATHWVYDLSALTSWDWLLQRLREDHAEPKHWLNVHSGYDESTATLRQLMPGTDGQVLDLFDPVRMSEPSIHRARKLFPAQPETQLGTFNKWPFAGAPFDTVFLLMAAHEFRVRAEREALFAEANRTLARGGRIIVVEHLRNGWNFLAYGPGCWHFWPRSEWRRLFSQARLTLRKEGRITPFVAYFILESSAQ